MTVQETKDQLPDVTVVPTFGVFLQCKTTGRRLALCKSDAQRRSMGRL